MLLQGKIRMSFILMHKENSVLSFSSKDDFNKLIIEQVYDEKLLPVGIYKKSYKDSTCKTDNERFTVWWKNRTIPSGRKNLTKALELLNVSSKNELLCKTHCLNLTDQYWVKKDNEKVQWREINYFDNGFDESVGEYLLLKRERTFSEKSFNSPDFFTDGLLPKKWIIKDGEVFLVKGTESAFQQEPFNEVLTSFICKELCIPHVKYLITVLKDDDGDEYFSMCKNFVTKDTEFVSAYDIDRTFKKSNNESDYQHFINCCNALGLKDFEADLQKMFLVDFIMSNTDRHLHNFGFLRDSDTLEWKGLAPVYDTERSMFLNKAKPKKSYNSVDIEAKPFKDNQAEQFNLLDKNILKNLPFENLKNAKDFFNDLLKNNTYIDEERRASLCSLLESKINLAIQLITDNVKIPVTKNKHQREMEKLQSLSIIVPPV